MKYASPGLFGILLTAGLLINSCEREHGLHKKPFKIETATWYRVSPTIPAPIEVNGTIYTSFVNFPGGGAGNAFYIGTCAIYFNQLAYGTSPEGAPAGSVSAPLTDAPACPVTGAPLPLIQAGDFNQLSAVLSSFHIPPSVHEKIVNTVLTNDKGDAIFFSAITGGGATFPVSPTVFGFTGKALIVTGRGKFNHAVGEVDFSGYFNLLDASDAAFKAEGWIAY